MPVQADRTAADMQATEDHGKQASLFLARTLSQRLLATPASQRVVVRKELEKCSAKVGVATSGDELYVVELAKTRSGTTRARLSAGGWATATTAAGKHLLRDATTGSAAVLNPRSCEASVPARMPGYETVLRPLVNSGY